MFLFSLLFSVCLSANVYFLKDPQVEGDGTSFSDIIEMDEKYVSTKELTVCCGNNLDCSFKINKEAESSTNGTVDVYYYYFYKAGNCSVVENEKIKVEMKIEPIKIVNQVLETTFTNDQDGFVKEYIIGNVCFVKKDPELVHYYQYVSSQFGVSLHHYTDLKCSLDDVINTTYTETFQGVNSTVSFFDVGESNFSLDNENSNMRVVQTLTTADDIVEKPQKIYEVTSSKEGKIYLLNKQNQYLLSEQTLNYINTTNLIGIGNVYDISDPTIITKTAYFFNKCFGNSIYVVIGSYFTEISYSDAECLNIESTITSDAKNLISIGEETYTVEFNKITVTGTRYKKVSNLECTVLKLGECLQEGEATSKQIVMDSNNEYVLASYSSLDCLSGLSIEYLQDLVESNPFDGKTFATTIQSFGCSISNVENAIISTNFVVNECSETTKYSIENEKVVLNTYTTSEECMSQAEGTKEIKYSCSACNVDEYAICPTIPEDDSSSSFEGEGSSTSSYSNNESENDSASSHSNSDCENDSFSSHSDNGDIESSSSHSKSDSGNEDESDSSTVSLFIVVATILSFLLL